VTADALGRIGAAEAALKALGFRQVRVRHHGEVARIEVEPSDLERLLALRTVVVARVREAGYAFIALDLEGYATGSLNRTWKPATGSSPSAD
jgi:pyridinium-3,5-biscarboxylic acid mononucleotide sulfurtransferase